MLRIKKTCQEYDEENGGGMYKEVGFGFDSELLSQNFSGTYRFVARISNFQFVR